MSTPEQPAARPASPPVCYRHPERETYIRCTRCERPICPDCMIPSSVGFQCPDDVRAGQQGVREARTRFGGRVAEDATAVTKVLIGINLLAFLLQQLSPTLEQRFWLVGGPVGYPALGFEAAGVADGEFYRLLTAAFLHGGFAHIALNMFALWMLGPPLESVFGRVRYIALYLVSALAGSAASYALGEQFRPALGASGAVFGLFAAYMVVGRKLGRDISGLVVLLAINVAYGFVASAIDWRAHAGGFVAGGLLALVLVNAPRTRRALLHTVAFVVVAALCLLVVVARTGQLLDVGLARVVSCVVTAPVDPQEGFLDCVDVAA